MITLTQKGLTLIEMIVIIVVVGLAIPALMTGWANVAWKSSRSEATANALFFAQELMEEVKAKRFDEKNATPWTNSSNLGIDSGETINNKATFDDVDDFAGTTDPLVTTPQTGYSRWVNASYVFLNSTNSWQSCTLPITCTSVVNCTNCTECCYKRIIVSVSQQSNLVTNLSLETIVSAN